MPENKPLKNFSIKEIEEAFALAISNLTGVKSTAAIGSITVMETTLGGPERYKIDLNLSITKQPPAKAGGFEIIRTESPRIRVG